MNLSVAVAVVLVGMFCIKSGSTYPLNFNFNWRIHNVTNLYQNLNFFRQEPVGNLSEQIFGPSVSAAGGKLASDTGAVSLPGKDSDLVKKEGVPRDLRLETSNPLSDEDDSGEGIRASNKDCNVDKTQAETPTDPPVESEGISSDLETSSTEADVLTEEEENILFDSGLDLDYSYNESRSETDHPDKLISSPGCPGSGKKANQDDYPFQRNAWVHYGNPPRCFLVGTRGPCPAGMRIGFQPNSSYGVCKCKCFVDLNDNEALNVEVLGGKILALEPFLDTKQEFCFDGKSHQALFEDKCYTLLTQGPCGSNEVFVIDVDLKTPVCRRRECREAEVTEYSTERYGFVTLYNGTCLKLGDTCGNEETVPHTEDEIQIEQNVIGTTADNPNPSCVPPYGAVEVSMFAGGASSFITANDCKVVNQTLSVKLGRCFPYTKPTKRKGSVG